MYVSSLLSDNKTEQEALRFGFQEVSFAVLGSPCSSSHRLYLPLFACVSDQVPKSEVSPSDDSVFEDWGFSAGDEVTGRWWSVPATRSCAFKKGWAL